ncbi:MAG: adenylate kinase [Acidobacteria bacterium]|nr:adenylate kinase [Acidobacteriota bacterium]
MSSVSRVSAPAPSTTRILLLLGPPGCGKGTQAESLARHFSIPAISTGEMIRGEIRAGTELGHLAAGVIHDGGLLGDDIVNRIVKSRLSQEDCAAGFMLDGYPRTVEQAHYLDALMTGSGLPQPTVIHLDVHPEHLIARICNRRDCPKCGAIYNLLTHPPLHDGACDHCRVELERREDDCETTVRNRLAAYEHSTAPLIDYYKQGNYLRVDGAAPAEQVFASILQMLN